MAYSFVNKFSDYADRLPPDLYAVRQERRGQGVLEPRLEYDRLDKCWYYPELPEAGRAHRDARRGARRVSQGHRTPSTPSRGSGSSRLATCVPATTPAISSTS